MTQTPPLIWIVVLNWNGAEDTIACLRSLQTLHYRNVRFAVVDNGSTDGSGAMLRRAVHDESTDLIETGKNLGFAGGNNVGIRHALDQGADFILVLNNDTIVDPGLLDELIAAADQHPEAGCFGPWIYYMHDRDRLWFTRSEWSHEKSAFTAPGKGLLASEIPQTVTGTEYVCGAALFFRAEVARRIGLLDERFFLVYEDSDWCFRARGTGFECLAVPSATIWHKVGTSFGSEASPLRTYFSTRNRLLWADEHVPRRERWRMLLGALRRFYPGLHIDRSSGQPLSKAIVWAARGYLREWRRLAHDQQEVAHRRAVVDYLLRRFGDCPPAVRQLTAAWSANRAQHPEQAKAGAPRGSN